MKTCKLLCFAIAMILCLVSYDVRGQNRKKRSVKKPSKTHFQTQQPQTRQPPNIQQMPSAQQLDAYLSKLNDQEKLDFLEEFLNFGIEAMNTQNQDVINYYIEVSPIIEKHLNMASQRNGINPNAFDNGHNLSMQQPQTSQQFDAMLANLSPRERETIIMNFWRTMVQAVMSMDLELFNTLEALAPVIQKYDSQFQEHSRATYNAIQSLMNGGGYPMPPNNMPGYTMPPNNMPGYTMPMPQPPYIPPEPPISSQSICVQCDGTGKCPMCHGEGRYMTNNNWHRCGVCHGTGTCQVCHGHVSSRSICIQCDGTGKCSMCHGEGRYMINNDWRRCGICHGTGACQVCHGRRYFGN